MIVSSTHYLFNCAELSQDFEAETGRVEMGLDPINGLVKDDVAMNVLRNLAWTARLLILLA